MGSFVDSWLDTGFPRKTTNSKDATRPPESASPTRAATSATTSPKEETLPPVTACQIEWDESTQQFLFAEEVPFDFQFALRMVQFGRNESQEGTHGPKCAVVARFEAQAPKNPKFQGQQLIVALHPISQGFVDAIPFRARNPKAAAKRPGAGDKMDAEEQENRSGSLQEELERIDKLTRDRYLNHKDMLVAGRFVFSNLLPNTGTPRIYRATSGPFRPKWIFGLCKDFEEVKKSIYPGRKEEMLAAVHAVRPVGEKARWSQNEFTTLYASAELIAERAARLVVAGYQKEEHRKRLERSGDPSVLAYAKYLVADITRAHIKLDIRAEAWGEGETER